MAEMFHPLANDRQRMSGPVRQILSQVDSRRLSIDRRIDLLEALIDLISRSGEREGDDAEEQHS